MCYHLKSLTIHKIQPNENFRIYRIFQWNAVLISLSFRDTRDTGEIEMSKGRPTIVFSQGYFVKRGFRSGFGDVKVDFFILFWSIWYYGSECIKRPSKSAYLQALALIFTKNKTYLKVPIQLGDTMCQRQLIFRKLMI